MKYICFPILLSCLFLIGCGFIQAYTSDHQTSIPKYDFPTWKPKNPKPAPRQISEEAEFCLERAQSAEKFSPALAYLNYKIALLKFQQKDSNSFQTINTESVSKTGVTSTKLRDEIIPGAKAKAMKSIGEDIFELIFFLNGYGEGSGIMMRSDELFKLVDMMESLGQKGKAEKIRDHIISGGLQATQGTLPFDTVLEKAKKDFQSGKKKEAIKALDDAVPGIGVSSKGWYPKSQAGRIALAYLDFGEKEKAKSVLMSVFESEMADKENPVFINLFEDIVDTGHFAFANEFINKIYDYYKKIQCMKILVDGIGKSSSPPKYLNILNTIHRFIIDHDHDFNSQQVNSPVLLSIATVYFQTGKKNKSNEIIKVFFPNYKYAEEPYSQYTSRIVSVQKDRNPEYEQWRVATSEIVKVLVETGQKDRAIKVTDEKVRTINRPNYDKHQSLDSNVDVIKSYLIVGMDDKADEIYKKIISNPSEYKQNKEQTIFPLLKLALAYHETGRTNNVEPLLKIIFGITKEVYPAEGKREQIESYSFKPLMDLGDYDTAFEIGAYLDKLPGSWEKFGRDMVNKLIKDEKFERAAAKYNYVEAGDYQIWALKDVANKYIDKGDIEKALSLTKLMQGTNAAGWIYTVNLDAACAYAKRGDLDKALQLAKPVDQRWPLANKNDLSRILACYVVSNAKTETQQREIISRILPDVLQYDYELSLVGTYQPGVQDKSLLELAHKAETNLLDCAHYLAVSSWGSPTMIAMGLTNYAEGLIELNMIDEARDALDQAYASWHKNPEHKPSKEDLRNMANLWKKLGDKKKAKEILDEGATISGISRDFPVDAIYCSQKTNNGRSTGYTGNPEYPIITCGFSSEGMRESENPHDDYQHIQSQAQMAIGYARHKQFKEAFEVLSQMDCMTDPRETFGIIAECLIDAKEYDWACATLEIPGNHGYELMCRNFGDTFGSMYRGYINFPGKFAEAGRFDLAIKSLKYVEQIENVKAIMKVEVLRRKADYSLTDDDKHVLRELIHTDRYYIDYPSS